MAYWKPCVLRLVRLSVALGCRISSMRLRGTNSATSYTSLVHGHIGSSGIISPCAPSEASGSLSSSIDSNASTHHDMSYFSAKRRPESLVFPWGYVTAPSSSLKPILLI